ncbi:unnamed protein product [Prorocentrum cordatum]|uniref:Anaphase-promoting complex subunit 1 n=1 Tax=Prorocentrum cordatum TaxID=2364126 RepID=A0ABN9TJM9_9DINO|nr:unnamed protein product [Polarella glacialis]
MEALLLEITRGISTALAVRSSAVPCPDCTCNCAPALACSEGALPREFGQETGWEWPGPWACFSLIGLGAVAGASAVLLAQRWLAPAPAAAPARAAGPAELADPSSARADLLQPDAMAAPHQLIAAGLAEGDFLVVRYRVGGWRLWHRRLVVALVPDGTTVAGIMTPDLDEYDEDVADQPGLGPRRPSLARPSRPRPRLQLPRRAPRRPRLWLDLAARGVRHVDFRTAVTRMTELPWPDWPVRGPRTLRWVAEFMAQRSGTPTAHHQRWLAETGLDPADPGVEIYQTGCVVLETAITYDQEHATNLAHLELVARSIQVQEEKYRLLVEPDDASAADRSAMMGASQLAGSVCVCPALRDYLASELQKEMAVAKERRKAPVPQAAMPSLPEGGRPGPPPPSLLQASAGANSAARASGEAGPPSREDGRQRNLFPLPQLTAADAAPGLSRTRRRARAGHALGRALDRASAAVHDLYGDKSSPESAVPTAGQRCAVGHIWDTIAALGPEPDEYRDDVSDPNGALRELLAGSALYPELQLIHDLLPLCTDLVGATGRVAEKWRYKVEGGAQARARAVGASEETDAAADLGYPLSFDSSDNANVGPGGEGAQDELGRSALDPRPPVDFEEVPAHFIRESAWGSVAAVFVDGQANILALEGGALVLGYRHLLRSTSSFGSRFLALSDNLPLVLSVGKGRARSRRLQSTLRKICALSVATGSTLSVRWIPSEANPADGRVGRRRHCRAWGCWIMRLHWLLALLPRAALAGGKQAAPTASALRGERARRAQELAAAAAPVLGLSLLERLAVRPSTEKLYRGALSAFASFCARHRLDWTDHASLDSVLAQYMDSEFLLGGGGNMGNVLLAAVAHSLGSLHKRAATQLPRAHLAAAAWARRAPGRTRLPLPRRVVFAIAGVLLRDGRSRLAICILVMFACYLRPGEAAKLRGRHLIAPSASAGTLYQYFGLLLHESGKGPGKTGVNDESILFDREGWLAPLLAALELSTLPDQPLWGGAIAQLPKLFDSACRELSLERLRPHLYSLRHGGASDDMLSQRRSLPEIQRRGRWRSAKSLNRYTKETKLLDELAWIPPAALELGAFVEDNLMALLFCGAGTIARAMVALGFAAFGLDWSRSPLEDHVAATFQTVALGWIQSRALDEGAPAAAEVRAPPARSS